jgi:phosphoglycerol transferase
VRTSAHPKDPRALIDRALRRRHAALGAYPRAVQPGRSTWLREWLVDGAAVVVTTLTLVVITFRLWEANLRIPFVYDAKNVPPLVYGPDASYYLMLVKSMIVHGTYLTNSSLGWPFSFQLYDNPESADQLQLQAQHVLGAVLGDPALTMNLYFLFTFVAVALSAWFVLRRLGVSRLVAGVVGVLFSFLPYHFARGEAHLLLAGYFMVPIAVLLALRVWSREPPFTVDRETSWRVQLKSRRSLLWLLACAAIGSTGPYYAFFAALLVGAAVVVDVVARRSLRTATSGAIAVATIAVVLLLNLAPSFVYWSEHGTNPVALNRGPSETEVDGLRVSQLVLPRQEHRIDALADLQRKSDRFSPVPSERGQQLGLIGALGLVGMLLVTFAALVRRPNAAGREPPDGESRLEVVTRCGVLTLFAVLFGAVSGFSLLVSGLGLHEIRSWNRLSIFIGFLALVAVAFALDWLVPRLPRWHGHAVLAAIVGGVVLVVGVLDQTSPADVPHYQAVERAWHSDDVFMHRIARRLGDNAAVFQLPYVIFPEAGFIEETGPYDQVRGWLHAGSLRWSWGSVHGREGDWQASVTNLLPAETLDRLAAVGFSGIMIDRAGYADHAQLLEQAYTDELQQRPLVSPNRRLLFYDLRPRARELRRRLAPREISALRRQTLAARGEVVRPDVVGE